MIESGRTLEFGASADNIVTMPNLMSGRLADMLAAASGPAQDHELRGELAHHQHWRPFEQRAVSVHHDGREPSESVQVGQGDGSKDARD